MSNNIIVECDVLGEIDSNSNWSEIEPKVVLKNDVG
jgi:hypothetical protein